MHLPGPEQPQRGDAHSVELPYLLSDPTAASSSASESGEEWWKPGARFRGRTVGAERRIAAFLWFNIEEGGLFTMRQIREALGEAEKPDDSEQLNRRLRALRPDGWIIQSYKTDKTLPPDSYKLEQKGASIWQGAPRQRISISDKLRTEVFLRDGSRCTRCGIGSGEPYPDDHSKRATLTVGHRKPADRGGKATLENLQTECARCNEPLRQKLRNPESLEELLAEVKELKKMELEALLEWLLNGFRTRSKLDKLYDRARMLSRPDQGQLGAFLRKMLGLPEIGKPE